MPAEEGAFDFVPTSVLDAFPAETFPVFPDRGCVTIIPVLKFDGNLILRGAGRSPGQNPPQNSITAETHQENNRVLTAWQPASRAVTVIFNGSAQCDGIGVVNSSGVGATLKVEKTNNASPLGV
jgi:hypothetical protein